ncbi:tape measure protein [Croceicoccus sp. YJ47]|uniref:tape measure protein n=1 Tax=Croceicoccus sp. YJ47 TaxID=2798724 RepID=UPI001921BAA2|nr:tape measure protein [Croceicoccus sp. YJ47]QQN73956.1 tape measure protein [Croceicoccus sp. YJ47]
MASSVVGALRVVLGLDSAEFESGIRRSQRSARGFEGTTRTLSGAVKGLGAALGIVSFGAAARGYLSLADQSANLTAQLRLATRETGSFSRAQEDVRRIAANSRAGLSETAQLYATFQRNAADIGITQQQSARSTETITKAFKISGATAAEAAYGLRQFLQGLQSGTLRGEELNSVLENAPRLAKALADGLGVTTGQLREMGSAGQIGAREIVQSLDDAAEQIDAEFRELPMTFEDAMTALQNSAIVTFGGFDRGGQFSQMLANFFMQGSEGFADMEQDAEDTGIAVRASFEGLGDVFDPLLQGAIEVFGGVRAEAESARDVIAQILRGYDRLNAVDNWIDEKVWGLETRSLEKDFLLSYDRSERRSRSRIGEQMIADWNRGYDALGNPIASDRRGGGSAGGGAAQRKKAAGGGRSSAASAARKAEAERNRIAREAERAADNMRRFTDEIGSQQTGLATSLAELSRSVEQRADAELSEIENRRAAYERSIQADDALNDVQRQQLLVLSNQQADADARLVKQRLADQIAERNARIEQDRADLAIELLQYTGDLARTAKEARAVELRIVDLAFDAERARLEQIKATSAVASAEYQYAEARLAALPGLRGMAQASARRQTMGPMEAYLDTLPRSADEAREALERVQVDGIDGIVEGLADAATGARTLGDVFKNVTKQIIADLIRIQLRKAIVSGLSSVLSGSAGSFGSTTAGFGAGIAAASNISVTGFNFGGARAKGGPVLPSMSYLVGERGPEIFSPGSAGTIIPNHDLYGGANLQVEVVANNNGFGAIVRNHAGQVVAEAAPSLVDAGGRAGVNRVAYRNSRRVG